MNVTGLYRKVIAASCAAALMFGATASGIAMAAAPVGDAPGPSAAIPSGDPLRNEMEGSRLEEILQELVDKGVITAEQKIAILDAAMAAIGPDKDESKIDRSAFFASCATEKALGWGSVGAARLTPLYMTFWTDEVRAMVKAGDREGFAAAVLAKVDARIDAAVAAGKISSDCAAELKSAARAHLEQTIDRVFAFYDRARSLKEGLKDGAASTWPAVTAPVTETKGSWDSWSSKTGTWDSAGTWDKTGTSDKTGSWTTGTRSGSWGSWGR